MVVASIAVLLTLWGIKRQQKETEDTLKEMKREHESSYQPVLIIPQIVVTCYQSNWFKPSDDNDIYRDLKGCLKDPIIHILNIGRGPAKNIKISWRFEYARILEILRQHQKLIHDPSDYEMLIEKYYKKYGPKWKSVSDEGYPINGVESFPYILPSNEQIQSVKTEIPNDLFEILEIILSDISRIRTKIDPQKKSDRKTISSNDIKYATVNISYSDIGDTTHSSNFLLHFQKTEELDDYYIERDPDTDYYLIEFCQIPNS